MRFSTSASVCTPAIPAEGVVRFKDLTDSRKYCGFMFHIQF